MPDLPELPSGYMMHDKRDCITQKVFWEKKVGKPANRKYKRQKNIFTADCQILKLTMSVESQISARLN